MASIRPVIYSDYYPKMEVMEVVNKIQAVVVKLRASNINLDHNNTFNFLAFHQVMGDVNIRKAWANEEKQGKRIYKPKIDLYLDELNKTFSLYIKKNVGGWKIGNQFRIIWSTNFMEAQTIDLTVPGIKFSRKKNTESIDWISSSDSDSEKIRPSGLRKRKKVKKFGDMISPEEIDSEAEAESVSEKRRCVQQPRVPLSKEEEDLAGVLVNFGTAKAEAEAEVEAEVEAEAEAEAEVEAEPQAEVEVEAEVEAKKDQKLSINYSSLEKFSTNLSGLINQAIDLEPRVFQMLALMEHIKKIDLDQMKREVDEAQQLYEVEKDRMNQLMTQSNEKPFSDDLRKQFKDQSLAFDQFWENLQEKEKMYKNKTEDFQELKYKLKSLHREVQKSYGEMVKSSPWK